MRVKLTGEQWSALKCEDPEIRDFVRRCYYLGYGMVSIKEWTRSVEGTKLLGIWADVVQHSDILGITDKDVVEKI